ncbi:hypothetical protein [Wenxinia marina]|uniref:Uncharacterized protein n=1 Tax=Wenxinia marina DSM 24838 TaxID=1123501 RepID=A0A0D0PGL5_9RHOB|nr:hypothetical protein [Wenxinia marina]KIQ70491.1 hypothetical protein Wenmar_00867 [Wenxinia marina DSM 24838]GGL52685.1 hypothetical protein GCM10011392_03840 [Wenxinia marina]
MRTALTLTAALAAGPAVADIDFASVLGGRSLAAAESDLSAIADPTPDERFALGGVRFLRGIERAFQLRYRVGLHDGLAVMSGLPVLRVPMGANPAPEPFTPDAVEVLFADIVTDMQAASDVLLTIGDADAVGVSVALGDLWFDIDMDGARSDGEGLLDLAGAALDPQIAATTIRFDTADAAWLSAYAHLLAGVGEVVLAIGPAEAIGAINDASESMDGLGGQPPSWSGMGSANEAAWIDLAAMALMALDGVPDAAHSRAAHGHFLQVVADNRTFWRRVARETDDDAEWIPNKAQTSATGLRFPPETGTLWLAVLSDAERVLTGELLLPFWRLGEGAGINLARVFEEPPSLDLAGLVHGVSLVPYMDEGPRAGADNLMLFSRMMGGDALLYALVLN